MALMARSGVESVRTVFSWERSSPRRTARSTSRSPDQQVGTAARHGLGVLPVMIYAPPAGLSAFPEQGVGSPPGRSRIQAFLRAAIRRYGSRGILLAREPVGAAPPHPLLADLERGALRRLLERAAEEHATPGRAAMPGC